MASKIVLYPFHVFSTFLWKDRERKREREREKSLFGLSGNIGPALIRNSWGIYNRGKQSPMIMSAKYKHVLCSSLSV